MAGAIPSNQDQIIMTNKEILENMKVGDIVTSGQLLSSLKKKGLISDYSEYGYLEAFKVHYRRERDDMTEWEYDLIELFPLGNAQEMKDRHFESRGSMGLAIHPNGISIEYMGCEFYTKYLSGCFKPYLQLTSKFGDRKKTSHPSMSMWGSIM